MRRLYTEEGRNLSEAAWTAYPRPQMRREDWLCLNGIWNLTVLHREEIRKEQIRVPCWPDWRMLRKSEMF